jgi:hypothetical protein
MLLSENERHAIAHAEWAVGEASPESPEVCFDYTLVQTLLALIKSGRGAHMLMAELADDLEAELRDKYNGTLHYPSQQKRYDRDMEPVRRARAVLADIGNGDD